MAMDVFHVWIHDNIGVRGVVTHVSDRSAIVLMVQKILAILVLVTAVIFLVRRMRQTFSRRKGGGCGPSCGCG